MIKESWKMKVGIPQMIYLALMFLVLGIDLCQHGKPKEGKHNFGVGLISTALMLYLLKCVDFSDNC